MNYNFKEIILVLFVLAVAVIMGIGGFFLFNAKGNKILIKTVLERNEVSESVFIKEYSGNLGQGLLLENLVLTNLKYLPMENFLKIQRLFIDITSLKLDGLIVELENARLFLPYSDPVLLNGKLKNNVLEANIFSSKFGLGQIQRLIPAIREFSNIAVNFENIDLYIKGSLEKQELDGSLFLKRLTYEGFALEHCPIDIKLSFSQQDDQIKPEGVINFKEGTVYSPKTALRLKESQIIFHGNIKNPNLNIHGESVIDKVKITLFVRGTKESPEIQLTSQPSLPEKQLMLMLATGKRWKSLEDSMEQGKLSADISKDFVDYFLFGGQGSVLAKRLGLHDVDVTFEKDKKGISAKKDLSNKLDVGYGVEKEITTEGETTTQKFQGDYKLTDEITFSVERELKGQTSNDKSTQFEQEINAPPPNDTILLKYKKDF